MSAYAGYKPAHEVFTGRLSEVHWGGKYQAVAVGFHYVPEVGTGADFATSNDISSWSLSTFSGSSYPAGVAYGVDGGGKGLWIAGGYLVLEHQPIRSTLMHSRDGFSWSTTNEGNEGIYLYVAFGYLKDDKQKNFLVTREGKKIGRWVYCGSHYIYTSDDGFSWYRTGSRAGSDYFGGFISISYANGLFFAGERTYGELGAPLPGYLHVSRDARSWTAIPIVQPSVQSQVNNVAYGNGMYVAAGGYLVIYGKAYLPEYRGPSSNLPGGEPRAIYFSRINVGSAVSQDGFSWSGLSLIGSDYSIHTWGGEGNTIAFGNGVFAMVGAYYPPMSNMRHEFDNYGDPFHRRIFVSSNGRGWGVTHGADEGGVATGIAFSKNALLNPKKKGAFIVTGVNDSFNTVGQGDVQVSPDGHSWNMAFVGTRVMTAVGAK